MKAGAVPRSSFCGVSRASPAQSGAGAEAAAAAPRGCGRGVATGVASEALASASELALSWRRQLSLSDPRLVVCTDGGGGGCGCG